MRRRLIALLMIVIAASVLLFNQRLEPAIYFQMSQYYIKHAFEHTGSANAITSIYLFYRYYDTLFEALMLLFSIIGVIYMSVHEEGSEYDS
ncbi:hypothetical protein ACR6HW_14885 [Fusibacter sp. JL298sf-3]